MDRLLRRKEVVQMVGLSRASIYRLMDSGDFPHPVRVGPRAVRWRLEDLEHWRSERPLATDKVEKVSKEPSHDSVLVQAARRDERATVDVVRLRTFR